MKKALKAGAKGAPMDNLGPNRTRMGILPSGAKYSVRQEKGVHSTFRTAQATKGSRTVSRSSGGSAGQYSKKDLACGGTTKVGKIGGKTYVTSKSKQGARTEKNTWIEGKGVKESANGKVLKRTSEKPKKR